MNSIKSRKAMAATAVILLMILLLAAGSLARAGTGYHSNWWTVDGGSGVSSAADLSVNGTVGQPDAGTVSGTTYNLRGGFWTVPAVDVPLQESHAVLLPVIMDGD